MVVGLNMSGSMVLLPFTIFVFCITMINPIVKLECQGEYCRNKRLSETDPKYNTTDFWWNEFGNLQSDGNLTLVSLSHGFVPCYTSQCGDCSGNDACAAYNHTTYTQFLVDVQTLNNSQDENNWEVYEFLNPNCDCLEFCAECDELHLVALPGPFKVRELWALLDCEEKAEEWGVTEQDKIDAICDLYNNFFKVVSAGALALCLLGTVFFIMCFVEYINFHVFCDGRCKFLFISPMKKKAIFAILLFGPLFLLFWLLNRLYNDTDDKLDAYFDAIGADFKYNWNTRGYVMWWICIGNVCLSIIALLMSGKTERHLQTLSHYRRGVNYEAGEVDPITRLKSE